MTGKSMCSLPRGDDTSEITDAAALAFMLKYVVAEAERLGLDDCARYADMARESVARTCRPKLTLI